jgi:hypothetical protein
VDPTPDRPAHWLVATMVRHRALADAAPDRVAADAGRQTAEAQRGPLETAGARSVPLGTGLVRTAVSRPGGFVFFALCYMVVRCGLQLAALRFRSTDFKELEIVVLRHELAILRRRARRPWMTWTDRIFLAAAGRLLVKAIRFLDAGSLQCPNIPCAASARPRAF